MPYLEITGLGKRFGSADVLHDVSLTLNQGQILSLIGPSGGGKTTFLEGILLALYGKNSFAYSENDNQTYGQYLRSYVNVSDGTKETSVDLTFFMNVDDTEEYRICREWNSNSTRTMERVFVYKDGIYNQFLTDNWAMFMENVLPSALSSFFFFPFSKHF